MNFQLPKIYPITDTALSGLSHSEQVRQLIAGGSRFIQLREKLASPKQFFSEVSAAMEIAQDSGAVIIVNDRADIALASHAHGVHLGQDDLPVTAARKLLGDRAIIGISTHNEKQVGEALKLPVNYIAFGPIYPTATKDDPDPVVGIELLRQVRQMAGSLPIVAIGGINASNLNEPLANGADSVAMISELFVDHSRIAEHFQELSRTAESVKQV